MRDDVRALVALSATIAQQDPELLETALAEAGQRATAEQVEETLLQSYLFVGYPAALQAIGRWREMSSREPETMRPGGRSSRSSTEGVNSGQLAW